MLGAVILVAVWSTAALAQSAGMADSIPVDLSGGGSVTWPSALLAGVYILTRSWDRTVDRVAVGLDRIRSEGRPLVRISVDECPARIPPHITDDPSGSVRVR